MQIPFLPQRVEQFLVVPLAVLHQRRQQQHFLPRVLPTNQVYYLLVRIVHHLLPRQVRVCLAGARVEQTKIVVYLRDSAHRRTWIAARRLLVNGNHRAQPRYLVHIRALHVADIPPRIRRESVQIPPLPLRKDGVEGERRLPATRQTRYHRQRMPRYLHADILQVMHPSTSNFYVSLLKHPALLILNS